MHLFSWALFHSCDSLVNSYMEKKGRYFQPFLQKTELHKKVRRCDSHPFWYSKGKQKYSSSGGAGPLHLQGCHSGTSSYFQPTSQHLRLRLLLPLWPAVTCLLRRFLLVPAPRTQCSLACGPRAGDEQLHLPSRSTRSTSMSAPDCPPPDAVPPHCLTPAMQPSIPPPAAQATQQGSAAFQISVHSGAPNSSPHCVAVAHSTFS